MKIQIDNIERDATPEEEAAILAQQSVPDHNNAEA